RHTRSYGDWSSDVCSSDLGGKVADKGGHRRDDRGGDRNAEQAASDAEQQNLRHVYRENLSRRCTDTFQDRDASQFLLHEYAGDRSEERRVGKECRRLDATD